VLAILVFGWQVYMQFTRDLSIWKGGGMGMFAGIDAPRQRLLKIYLRDPLGQRILVNQFNSRQQRLITAARIEPTDVNFAALSENLLASRWVLNREMVEVIRVDQSGSRLDAPSDLRPAAAPANGGSAPSRQTNLGNVWYPSEVRIEFWKFGYDVDSSRLTANRMKVVEARQRGSGD
jgi:hypothetical protein